MGISLSKPLLPPNYAKLLSICRLSPSCVGMGCIYNDTLRLSFSDNMTRGTFGHMTKWAKLRFPHVGRQLVLGFHLIAIWPRPLGHFSYATQVY